LKAQPQTPEGEKYSMVPIMRKALCSWVNVKMSRN